MNVLNNCNILKNIYKPCLCSEPGEIGENGNEDGAAG